MRYGAGERQGIWGGGSRLLRTSLMLGHNQSCEWCPEARDPKESNTLSDMS